MGGKPLRVLTDGITTYYPIEPVAKPRMTRRDRWKKPVRPCVAKYWAFRDLVQLLKVELLAGDSISFILPMPPSWSMMKKKLMLGKPHLQTPDIKNLLAALEDACHANDSHLWRYKGLEKLWGWQGEIRISHD